MLSLQIKSGDYITIGDNIVIQVFKESSSRMRVSIQAPRETPVLRGAVREREGGERPSVLKDSLRPSPSSQRYAERQQQKLAAQRRQDTQRVDAVQQLRSLLDTAQLQPSMRAAFCEQLDRLVQLEAARGSAKHAGREKSTPYNRQGASQSDQQTGCAARENPTSF